MRDVAKWNFVLRVVDRSGNCYHTNNISTEVATTKKRKSIDVCALCDGKTKNRFILMHF